MRLSKKEEEREKKRKINDCNSVCPLASALRLHNSLRVVSLKPRVVCQFLRPFRFRRSHVSLKSPPNAKVPRAKTGYLLGHYWASASATDNNSVGVEITPTNNLRIRPGATWPSVQSNQSRSEGPIFRMGVAWMIGRAKVLSRWLYNRWMGLRQQTPTRCLGALVSLCSKASLRPVHPP